MEILMEGQSQKNTLEFSIHFRKGRSGRKEIRVGPPQDKSEPFESRIPRISRLMALAIKMDGMIQRGEVKDYAELAVLGHVSRARITQIMKLLVLAPDIQEHILCESHLNSQGLPISENFIRCITRFTNWEVQRNLWK